MNNQSLISNMINKIKEKLNWKAQLKNKLKLFILGLINSDIEKTIRIIADGEISDRELSENEIIKLVVQSPNLEMAVSEIVEEIDPTQNVDMDELIDMLTQHNCFSDAITEAHSDRDSEKVIRYMVSKLES